MKRIENSIANTLGALNYCQEALASHPYAIQFEEFHELVVNKSNWKYCNLGEVNRDKKGKKNNLIAGKIYTLLLTKIKVL